MNILIIEDDLCLSKKIQESFQKYTFANRVDLITNYSSYLQHSINFISYDIILLDIDLGEHFSRKGFEILSLFKKKFPQLPIIMMTGHSEYHFIEEAFQKGAHDYIIKPFRPRELQIRIERWFRNYIFLEYFSTHKILEYYEMVYDVSAYEFYYKKEKITLSRGNKYLLSLFFIHREKILSHYFLSEKIWGHSEFLENRNLRIKILRLKKQLKIIDIDSWIESSQGEGYIFKKT